MVVMQLIWSGGAAHEFGHNYRLSHSSKLVLAPSDPLPANMVRRPVVHCPAGKARQQIRITKCSWELVDIRPL